MKLSAQQLEQFEREGYLFFPNLFTSQEVTPPEELQGVLKAA
jgi:hypothetical protein